tara:strand:+ start:641 stop:970 length:330 start_codon:yes stop_codon:yes gene_type:complete
MYYELTEIKQETVEGQLQKHFQAVAYEDESKAVVTAEQRLILSGDALDDPEQAFINGLTQTTDNYVPTYDSKRANGYPTIEEQLDDIYHNGIDGWKTAIKVVKDKYPKE